MIMNKNQNNVYLRCLPRGFTETQLTELCEPYGELTCTRLRESGVAFVRYRKPEDAQNAIRKLNGKQFDGHNECLLAKLANSDPFQPKIGFKEHGQYDNNAMDDGDENDTMSTNTMTPSQDANNAFNHQQHPNNRPVSQQQQQQQQRQAPQQQQQQQNMYHQQPMQQHQHHYGAPQHVPYGHPAPHYPPGPNQYDPQRSAPHYGHPPHIQSAPHHYGAAPYYDQRAIHPAYSQYAPPPPTMPHYAMDPNQYVPPPQHPYGPPPQPTYYGQTYPPQNVYYNAYPPQYVQPNLQQPVTPNLVQQQQQQQQQQVVSPTLGQQTSLNPTPKTMNSSKSETPTNALKSVNNAPPYIPTSQQPQVLSKAPILTKSQSDNTGTVTPKPQPITSTLTPQQMHKVLNGKSPNTVYIPSHAPTNAQPVLFATATPNQFMISHPISPPGSELSFRQNHGSELSAIASNAAELVMNSGPSKIATAKQIIPITPTDTSGLGPAISNNLFGQISPGPNSYNVSAHQWHSANANSNKAATPVQVQPVMIESNESAVKGLNIVKDIADVNEEKKELSDEISSTAAPVKVGDVAKMQRKESNPHNVDKTTCNKLHQTISEWYPKQAGKLTGMFLQNHNQERVIKYLQNEERLKNKIATFAELLSKKNNNANEN